jgi:signal transduction histidine kinase
LNIAIYILLITAAANFMLAIYSLRYRKSPGIIIYCLLLLAFCFYSFGYAFELQSVDPDSILFWLRVQYIGISYIPSLLIMLALHYTGKTKLLKPGMISILLIYGFITLFMQFTNFKHLYYLNFNLIYSDNLVFSDFGHGPWYWVHQTVMNLMLLISTILYLIHVLRTTGTNQIRASIMLISCIIPYVIYLIYMSGYRPHNLDLNPFSFTLVGFLFAIGVFRFQLLEHLPVTLEHVFNSMTDGVVIIDNHGNLVSYNQSATRLYPQLIHRIKGEPLDILLKGLPPLPELKDGYENEIEIPENSSPAFFHIRVVALKNDRKRSRGWTVIFTNVTERRLKENRLVQKEKVLKGLNANKDKFLAMIGHDLRNSFHLMINLSDMLISNIETDNKEGALKKANIIYDTSVSTYHLLQNLLEWALLQQKGMQVNKTSQNITALVNEEVQGLKTLYEQKELTVSHITEKPAIAIVDREMIKTTLRNLISNAIKYSYPGGNIRIIETMKPDTVTISIIDNGTGMTPEEQGLLFGPDDVLSKKGTASEDGTGLGLRLCREFVQLHHGEITVTSEPAKGSTFSFTIPRPSSLSS